MQRNWITKALMAALLASMGWVTLFSQTPISPVQNGNGEDGVTIVPSTTATGQQIVLFDARTRSLAVYHIEGGKIFLRSVRNIAWDLTMEQFNGQAPLPSELRQLKPQ